mgnify:CR=1 FL=1
MNESYSIVPIAPNTIVKGQDGNWYQVDAIQTAINPPPSPVPTYPPTVIPAYQPPQVSGIHIACVVAGIALFASGGALVWATTRQPEPPPPPPTPVIVAPDNPRCIIFC